MVSGEYIPGVPDAFGLLLPRRNKVTSSYTGGCGFIFVLQEFLEKYSKAKIHNF